MKEFKEGIIYFKLYSFHGVYEKERILFLHENKKVPSDPPCKYDIAQLTVIPIKALNHQ